MISIFRKTGSALTFRCFPKYTTTTATTIVVNMTHYERRFKILHQYYVIDWCKKYCNIFSTIKGFKKFYYQKLIVTIDRNLDAKTRFENYRTIIGARFVPVWARPYWLCSATPWLHKTIMTLMERETIYGHKINQL